MPGISRKESVVDTGFETSVETMERIQKVFSDLRREALSSEESVRNIIRVEAKNLARLLEE